jgi:hypothetical protein
VTKKKKAQKAEAMIDQAGKLYLGRAYDLGKGAVSSQPLLYNARHLTTHGVILGMTGSGKTGLGVILLEEALLSSIPVLVIDPKGDMANLLLNFPRLQPEEFLPWVDPEAARRKGLTLEQYAAQEAEKWRAGLADWGIGADRISRLQETAKFTIFTPGSEAGQPVDVIHFFEAPNLSWDQHEEALRERIGGMVSALLGLVGVEADPLQSPEHILLARIIEHAWRAGDHVDLPVLIQLIQEPPLQQVGVFDVETFFPEKDRFALARQLNNLVAAPGFEDWQRGTPLDVGSMLYASDGRPRASIFYLAHLDDSQRSFFVTLLLEAARDWLRAQSGTTDLRALLYFDEVFGFFPPHPVNPPSKRPLMALIKQGRAAGFGVVLATQNPVDVDYKGLTNAGTWAIGALRTERDKDRVLEGLETASAEAGAALARRTIDKALGGLKPRVFLLHDIREGAPLFFHTRWAMSYLRGPLTRDQVRDLQAATSEPKAPPDRPAPAKATKATREPVRGRQGLNASPPALPPEIPQVFLPPTLTYELSRKQHDSGGATAGAKGHQVVYSPQLLALGLVRMVDRKRDVDEERLVARLVSPEEGALGIDWEAGATIVDEDELSSRATGEGLYAPVPTGLARQKQLNSWNKDFADYLYYNTKTTILHNPALKLYGEVGESRLDFQKRCEEAAREGRDAELKKERDKAESKMETVQKRLRREKRELSEDEEDLAGRKREELLSLGESALNLLTGRRSSRMVSSASRKRRLTKTAKADVEESLAAIEDYEQELAALSQEWQERAAEINDRWAETLEEIEEVEVSPRRQDVRVTFCGLAWVPVYQALLPDGSVVELPARAS